MDNRFLTRGRCPHTGNWYAGYLMTSRDGYHSPYKMSIMHDKGSGERDPWRIISIDPATIGQCTGLSASKSYRGDKPEDLLIFEGDRVRLQLDDGTSRDFEVHIKSVVREVVSHPDFDDPTAMVEITGVMFSWNGYDLFPCIAGGISDCSRMEIIGTIHDQKGGESINDL